MIAEALAALAICCDSAFASVRYDRKWAYRPFFTRPAADESDAVFVPLPASDLAQHGSHADEQRSRPSARCSQWHCSSGHGCTTERLNTHKTDTREVRYRWHPWYACQVVVRGIRHRRGVIVLNCRADDDGASPVLEVPEWMFDPRICRRVRQGETATVDCCALRALRTLLASRFGVEAEVQTLHHPVIPGGADAKASEVETDTVLVVPAAPTESESARRSSSENRASAGANAAPARGPRLLQGSGPGGEQ
jgi:hypothetical protein